MRGLQIAGSGDYASFMKSVKSTITPLVKNAIISAGGVAGNYLGNAAGMSGGNAAGRALASRFSKLIGTGDYATNLSDVTHNSLVKASGASEYASFADSKTSVRLRHREYLQDVFVGTAGVFSNTSFAINPGLSNTFPFLSQIASNFEEYHMHGLVFEFVSTTSPYSSTPAMGSVVLAMEYNAGAPPYTSKPQMENSDFAVSARPDKSMIYGVECANNATANYYIRSGASSLPPTTTDIGLFNVATLTNIAAGINLGELWVSYDIELFRPHVSPAKYGYAHWSLNQPINSVVLQPITYGTLTVPVGVPQTGVRQGTCSNFYIGNLGGPTVTFDGADTGDTFMIIISSKAAAASAVTLTVATVGLTAINALQTYTTFGTATSTTSGFTSVAYYTVTSNSVTPTITYTVGPAITAAGALDLILVDIGNGLSVWPNNSVATL